MTKASPPPGGGRREQIIRYGLELQQRYRLTADDAGALARTNTPEVRAKVAAKLGHQFGELAAGAQADLADAVLRLLVRDVAREVRTALASAIAASTALPHDVA